MWHILPIPAGASLNTAGARILEQRYRVRKGRHTGPSAWVIGVSRSKVGRMVSTFATGYPTDEKGRRFRRRSYRPAIVIVAVLALIAVIVWSVALTGGGDEARPVDCPMPSQTEGARLQPVQKADQLSVAPAALGQFQVTVLNAGAARGQARSISDDLAKQGFAPGDPAYGDDTLYGEQKLDCVAQIRFGQAGQSAASSLWLAVPCAQLVNDGRAGTDVELALGEYWDGLSSSQDVQAALEALRAVDPNKPKSTVDPQLIESVHSISC